MGCFQTDRNLTSSNMSTTLCLRFCAANGFSFAGLHNGVGCHCARTSVCNNHMGRLGRDRCGVPCPGDLQTFCGGLGALQIYRGMYFCIGIYNYRYQIYMMIFKMRLIMYFQKVITMQQKVNS